MFVFPAEQLVVVVTSRSDVDGERSGRNADLTFELLATGIVPALE